MIKLDFSTLLSENLGGMVGDFLSAIPNIVMAIVIIIIGLIVAKIIANTFKKLLQKANVDKLGEKLNEIEIVEKANLKFKFSGILSKVLYYFLLIFFLIVATDILNMPAISELVSKIFYLIPKLIVALVLLVIGILFAELIRKVVYTALKSLNVPSANLVSTFIFYFLFINFALSALDQAEINTEILSQNISILIGGAVLAFAIGYGFASKESVSNFLSSFYTKGKINVGDNVTLEGVTGVITDMDSNSLTITNDTGKTILPLSTITRNKIHIHK